MSRRVEVHDRVDDLIAHGWSGSNEDGQAVQSRIDEKGITLKVLVTFYVDYRGWKGVLNTLILLGRQTKVDPAIRTPLLPSLGETG